VNNFTGLKTAINIILVTPHSYHWDCIVEIVGLLIIGLYVDLVNGEFHMSHKKRKSQHRVAGERKPKPSSAPRFERRNRMLFKNTVRATMGGDAAIVARVLEDVQEVHPFGGRGGA